MKRKKPKRPFGEILLDLEVLIDEAIDDHDIQDIDWHALNIVHFEVHRRDAMAQYLDGTFPEIYIGPRRKK